MLRTHLLREWLRLPVSQELNVGIGVREVLKHDAHARRVVARVEETVEMFVQIALRALVLVIDLSEAHAESLEERGSQFVVDETLTVEALRIVLSDNRTTRTGQSRTTDASVQVLIVLKEIDLVLIALKESVLDSIVTGMTVRHLTEIVGTLDRSVGIFATTKRVAGSRVIVSRGLRDQTSVKPKR